MKRLFALLLCLPSLGSAQEVTSAEAGSLRVLDKTTGTVSDVELAVGETTQSGPLTINLGDCRYPTGNPSGNAYALLTIHYGGREVPVFEGWMIASAPAVNAMEHPRYDVWVLRCKTS